MKFFQTRFHRLHPLSNANDIIDDLRLLAGESVAVRGGGHRAAFAGVAEHTPLAPSLRQNGDSGAATDASSREDAMAELEKIRALIQRGTPWPMGGRFQELSADISSDGFGLVAPRRSTEEFLIEAATSSRLDATHQSLLADFLSRCDF